MHGVIGSVVGYGHPSSNHCISLSEITLGIVSPSADQQIIGQSKKLWIITC